MHIVIKLVTRQQMVDTLRLQRQSLVSEKPTQEAVFFFVKASNLPVRVKICEIMNFFQGYRPSPVSIRLNVTDSSINSSRGLQRQRQRES